MEIDSNTVDPLLYKHSLVLFKQPSIYFQKQSPQRQQVGTGQKSIENDSSGNIEIQEGGNLSNGYPIFRGARYYYQEGSGFGDVLKGIFRFVLPIAAQGLSSFLGETIKGHEKGSGWSSAAKSAILPATAQTLDATTTALKKSQSGKGRRRRRGRRHHKKKQGKNLNTNTTNVNTIPNPAPSNISKKHHRRKPRVLIRGEGQQQQQQHQEQYKRPLLREKPPHWNF